MYLQDGCNDGSPHIPLLPGNDQDILEKNCRVVSRCRLYDFQFGVVLRDWMLPKQGV